MRISLFKKIIIGKIHLLIIACLMLPISSAQADVVKPALIEITVNTDGQVEIEIRASIEALLTGINSQYKNTQDSPNAEAYDVLRKLESDQLGFKFESFKAPFLGNIRLTDNRGDLIPLSIKKVDIPEPGYTKVPRISVIELEGQIGPNVTSLQWYYPVKFGDNAVRLKQVDKIAGRWHWSEWQWLRKDVASEPYSLKEIVADRPMSETVLSYIVIGFEHILPIGLDHILFILGLFLLSVSLKPLLWQVTMFTVAHTITLGLAMNGIIELPASVVEPLIALSIAYVGIENVFARFLHNSRLILVFAFGLLHGLGFASVLAEFGMPENAFVIALISFNVGVELGQLAVIAAAFLLVGFWFGKKAWYRRFISVPASLLIAIIAFYWFVERLDLNFI